MRQELCDKFGIDLAEACNAHPEWAKKMRLGFTYITNNNGDVLNFSVSPIEDVDVCEEASTMGCRTQNGYNINAEESIKRNMQAMIDGNFDKVFDGIFSAAQRDGRGNISPQTIILPEVAMRAKQKFVAEYDDNIVEVFLNELNKALDLTCESLKYRFDLIASQDASIAPFMYKNKTMIGYRPEEGIVSALKNGTLAVGMVGLSECLKILIGKDHTTEKGMELANTIMTTYENKCNEYKKKYSLGYSVYFTPAESLAGKAMTNFKERWGNIEGVTEHEYFTNSMHVPVWYKCNPFEKIDMESKLTKYGTAGVITYVELESSIQNNLSALETIVNYAMYKDIPYFAINVPVDECVKCGWLQEMDKCPNCGSENIRKLRRLSGYLGADIPNANKWKQAEFKDRVKHK